MKLLEYLNLSKRLQTNLYTDLSHKVKHWTYTGHRTRFLVIRQFLIDHLAVVCSVTWPLNGSEAGGDLALIQTLLLSCK